MSPPDVSSERVRRVITGHTDGGHAVVVADEHLHGRRLAEQPDRIDTTFFQLWATDELPIDNSSEDALSRGRDGSVKITIGTGSGSVLRIGVFAPGARSPMHRTHSLDYGICLEGECELELDGGEIVTVKAGDVVIQRGTNHRWHNRSGTQCRLAWILLDAAPVTVDGQPLSASWGDS
jgi:quercetin dioxygenase-like cupin family protein